jgi:hypothetical protein
MVRAKLRGLERKLVLERAEVRLEGMVNNLAIQWNTARQLDWPLKEPIDFIREINDQGFFPRLSIKALTYLEECKREGILPDQMHLLQILLPWYK